MFEQALNNQTKIKEFQHLNPLFSEQHAKKQPPFSSTQIIVESQSNKHSSLLTDHINASKIEKKRCFHSDHVKKTSFSKALKDCEESRYLSQKPTNFNEIQINRLFNERLQLDNKKMKINNTELIDLTNDFESNENLNIIN